MHDDDRYLVISSDCHGGAQLHEYRPYLESQFHPQFDEWVVERHEHRRLVEEVNGEYVARWESENAEALKGAYDPVVRDKVLDADGVAGEVIFADGDSVTLIKDLKVKGTNQTLKQGTVIKSIRLTDNAEEIDCRHEGIKGLVLRTEFVRKR